MDAPIVKVSIVTISSDMVEIDAPPNHNIRSK